MDKRNRVKKISLTRIECLLKPGVACLENECTKTGSASSRVLKRLHMCIALSVLKQEKGINVL